MTILRLENKINDSKIKKNLAAHLWILLRYLFPATMLNFPISIRHKFIIESECWETGKNNCNKN
jgi:hypothetical protein